MDPCIKEKDLATLQSEVKAIFKRMDEQLGVTRAVYELTAEIKVMNQSITTLATGQDQLKRDVEELKSKPGRKWENMTGAALIALITGVIGFALAKFL